jgi:hypothetical protein
MVEPEPLTPTEVRALRVRRAVAWWGQLILLAIVVMAMFSLMPAGTFAWVFVAIPAAVLNIWLHSRGVRCPRCRKTIYGPRPADDNAYYAGDPVMIAPPLPARCLSCGIGLSASIADS